MRVVSLCAHTLQAVAAQQARQKAEEERRQLAAQQVVQTKPKGVRCSLCRVCVCVFVCVREAFVWVPLFCVSSARTVG